MPDARQAAVCSAEQRIYLAYHRRRAGTERREALCQFGLFLEEKEADVADGRPVRQLQMLHPKVKRPSHRLSREAVKHLGGKLPVIKAAAATRSLVAPDRRSRLLPHRLKELVVQTTRCPHGSSAQPEGRSRAPLAGESARSAGLGSAPIQHRGPETTGNNNTASIG